MPSIRKTRKRLKREIAEDEMILSNEDILYFTDYISQHLEQKKQELQQLKSKKR